MNVIYGLGLFLYGEVRLKSFLYPGHIRLGNWPQMLDNGPYLSAWNVLSLGTFCLWTFCLWDVLSLGRCFVPGTFCPLWRFVPFDVLSLLTLSPLWRFVPWDILSWDVLSWEVLSWEVLSWEVLSWDVLSWEVLSWDVLYVHHSQCLNNISLKDTII